MADVVEAVAGSAGALVLVDDAAPFLLLMLFGHTTALDYMEILDDQAH